MNKQSIILYVSVTDYPNSTANSVQQIKTAHSIARCGVKVQFIAKNSQANSHMKSNDDIFEYYSLDPHPCLEFHAIQVASGRQRYREFIARAAYYATKCIASGIVKVFWSREPRLILAVAPMAYIKGTKLVFEAHDLADIPGRNLNARTRVFYMLAMRISHVLVTVTERGKEEMIRRGIPSERIVVAPDAANPLSCSSPSSHLTGGVRLAYAGSLHEDRGVETLVHALSLLPESLRAELIIVGGEQIQICKLKKLASELRIEDRINFTGHIPHAQVHDLLAKADILIQPMGLSVVSIKYTSPMKLFEYMATGRPIVACEVPTIREVVDGNQVYFCKPDDPASMAEAIEHVIARWPNALQKAERAKDLFLRKYTFEHRAKTILSAIGV